MRALLRGYHDILMVPSLFILSSKFCTTIFQFWVQCGSRQRIWRNWCTYRPLLLWDFVKKTRTPHKKQKQKTKNKKKLQCVDKFVKAHNIKFHGNENNRHTSNYMRTNRGRNDKANKHNFAISRCKRVTNGTTWKVRVRRILIVDYCNLRSNATQNCITL
jgi:hypothetical protein